jgi:hypothetical protein
MAEHGTVEIGKATGNDYAEHLRTYRFFLNLTKYSLLVIVIILILMAFFLL